MKPHQYLRLALLTLAAWAVAATSGATIVLVDYRDQNPPDSPFPNAGGPHWTGYVDTTTDTLTILTWVEIPGSTTFWTPWTPDLSVSPLVWPAIDFSGAPYDVPDTYSGPIDGTFGFVSTVSARNMQWNEGDFTLPESADFYPGWGGMRAPVSGQNPVVLAYDTTSDHLTMPRLPISEFAVSASTLAIVTFTPGGSPESIPEASAWLFGVAAASSLAIGAQRRRLKMRCGRRSSQRSFFSPIRARLS